MKAGHKSDRTANNGTRIPLARTGTPPQKSRELVHLGPPPFKSQNKSFQEQRRDSTKLKGEEGGPKKNWADLRVLICALLSLSQNGIRKEVLVFAKAEQQKQAKRSKPKNCLNCA